MPCQGSWEPPWGKGLADAGVVPQHCGLTPLG